MGAELLRRKDYLGREAIETIYFGGGTPSLIDPKFIGEFLAIIRDNFALGDDVEITLEANPDDINPVALGLWRKQGVNRLSIGIQSFFDEDLKFMNRAHDAKQAMESINLSRAEGFTDLTVDLIYGLPEHRADRWKKNVDTVMELQIDHLSCYALTIEPRTALAAMVRKGSVKPTSDEHVVSDFEVLMETATKSGFEHYEISNFARGGRYSKHNTSYWLGKKYLGIGPSAHSYDKVSRQWNISNNSEYIRLIQSGAQAFEREILTEKNKLNEYVLTSLRTMWGIDLLYVQEHFGMGESERISKLAQKFIASDQLTHSNNTLKLTNSGKLVADRIAAECFSE